MKMIISQMILVMIKQNLSPYDHRNQKLDYFMIINTAQAQCRMYYPFFNPLSANIANIVGLGLKGLTETI